MFENFQLATYEVIMEAGEQGLNLPPYKGSTLRGGFGKIFRRISCSIPNGNCLKCILRQNCPYAYIFETAPPEDAVVLRKYENIPRPFILEPPLETKTFYNPGEPLTFGLILIGMAISYLPYFIVVFNELAETGLGKYRKKCMVREIRVKNPLSGETAVVYSKEEGKVRKVDMSIRAGIIPGLLDLERQNPLKNEFSRINRIALNYLTMTRLKFEESYVDRVEFHILIRSLLRRVSLLAYFHHGQELKMDFSGIVARAREVKLIEDKTTWVDWERFSSRQDTRLKMGGVVGKAVYEGPLDIFLPLLRLGTLIHVGKGTVFGMGKYQIETIEY